MDGQEVQRRLAAIVAMDVAGYSRMMGADEEGTLARLKALRADLFDPAMAKFRGRLVKTTGDGFLIEFASVVDAFRFATTVQEECRLRNADLPDGKAMVLRIGINVGDIMVDEGDVFGDGVNIAARLEQIARPGMIYVSDRAWRDLRKLDVAFDDLGPKTLKNIAEPVRVYCARPGERPAPQSIARRWRPAFTARRLIVGGLVLAVVVAAGLFLVLRRTPSGTGAVALALPAIERLSPDIPATLPANFKAELASAFATDPVSRIAIAGDNDTGGYVLTGAIRRTGDQVRLLTTLKDGASQTALLDSSYDLRARDMAAIPQQAAFFVSGRLQCGFDLLAGARQPVPIETRQLAFRYCLDLDAGTTVTAALDDARQLTVRLPDLSGAWSALATAAAIGSDAGKDRALAEEARAAAAKARQLDPGNAEAYFALTGLSSPHDYAGLEKLLRQATNARPTSCGCEFHHYGTLLLRTGQTKAALAKLQTASDLRSLDPSVAANMIEAYRLDRQNDVAIRVAKRFAPVWPAGGFYRPQIRSAFALHEYNLVRPLLGSDDPDIPLPEALKAAMIEAADALAAHDEARIAAAGGVLEALSRDPNLNNITVVELLGLLGRDAVAADAASRLVKQNEDLSFELFSPALAGARRLPAMADTFRALGLIDYWKSGPKPDFCATERLPAFCS